MKTNIISAIWLDSDKAYILNSNQEKYDVEKVYSNIEHQVRYDGETDSASRFGSQNVDSEKRTDERRKHQEHNYFTEIIKKLPNPDRIMICGPSLAKKGLEKEIKSVKSISAKLEDVLTVDSMTENQILAYLKKYISEVPI